MARETIPEGAVEVGTPLIGRSPKGEVRPVTVKEIKEKPSKADAPAAESTPAQQ